MSISRRTGTHRSAALLTALVGLFAAAPASAVIITWELNNFVFEDGGIATGFFDWDTVAQSSTNFEFMVSGGDTATFPAFTWDDESGVTLFAIDDPGNQTLAFHTNGVVPRRDFRIGLDSLSALDTPIAMLFPSVQTSTSPGTFVDCFNCGPFRVSATAGGAFLSADTGVPVPEPATVLLVGGAMLALGRVRRSGARL